MERRLASCPVRWQPRRPCLRLMSTDLSDPGTESNASHDQQQYLPTFDRACLRVQAGAEDSHSRHAPQTTSIRAAKPLLARLLHRQSMGAVTGRAAFPSHGLRSRNRLPADTLTHLFAASARITPIRAARRRRRGDRSRCSFLSRGSSTSRRVAPAGDCWFRRRAVVSASAPARRPERARDQRRRWFPLAEAKQAPPRPSAPLQVRRDRRHETVMRGKQD